MQRKKSFNPMSQEVRGIFIFQDLDDDYARALQLLKSLGCKILQDKPPRMLVKTSRGNLQNIKKCWQSKDDSNALSQELNACVTQIIIGS